MIGLRKSMTFLKNFTDIRKLLFNNIGVRQTIFKNTFWLALAEGVSRFLKLILIIYVARILGATEYGKFNFALAFVGLFAIFSDLGISQILTREIAKENQKEKEFPAILSLKIFLLLGTLFLILIGSFFITPEPQIQKIIWILGLFSVIEGFSVIFFAFFQARQKMEYQSWTKILEAVLVTAFGFFVIFKFPSVENLSYSYLFAAFLALIFILIIFHFKVLPLKLSFNTSIWKNFLSLSWPLALASVFATIYSQTDSLVMGYLRQITQLGWYHAAYKIIGVTFIPAGLIATTFFPTMTSAFKKSKEKLQRIWDYFLESMIFLAIPIMVGGITLAPKIIDWIYDPTYFSSILAFQILILIVGFVFLSNPFAQILIVANQQKKLFWITLSGAIIDLILNIILVPKYSLYGAAITTVFSAFLVLFLLCQFTLKFTPIKKPFDSKSLLTFIGACLSSLPMYLVISQPKIYNLNVFSSILIGAVIYTLIYLILRTLIKYFQPSLCR